MNWSIKLFQVKGIDVKVHLTFVLILVWAAFRWSSSTGQGVIGALFGVAATLLLFAAVTVHELSHSFQALKYGVPVKDITLLPMGGLARIEEMPRKPAQELKIALAGPLVNLAIAAVLIGLGALLQVRAVISLEQLSQSIGRVSWSGMLAYLTMANIALGLFNLIPAYPMDGGRILRALLSMRTDHSRATQIATRVGQVLALALGLWGLLGGGYTLILIALFIWMSAGQERKGVQVEDGLRGINVSQAMTRTPHSLAPNDMLSKAVDLTLATAQSDFPVVEWGTNRVIGVLTEVDLLNGLKRHGDRTVVREVMRPARITFQPDQPLAQAVQQMSKNQLRAVPVVDEEQLLVGLLTSMDINEAYRLVSLSHGLAASTD